MVAILARYAARFSVRALDLTVDASLLWVGVGLALAAAVLLAFVPRLPSADASNGFGLSNGSVRITSGTNRRLRLFAVTQIAASFVLLAGAGMLLTTLIALQAARDRLQHAQRAGAERAGHVLHAHAGADRRRSTRRRCGASRSCPAWSASPSARWCRGATPARSVRGFSSRWRDTPRRTAKRIRARGSAPSRRGSSRRSACRSSPAAISPRPTAATPSGSSSSARAWRSGCSRTRTRVNRRLMWTDPVMKFIDVSTEPRRIVGVAADVDDENVVPGPAMTRLSPVRAGDRRRPPLRPHADRSVCAGAADHAHHSRAVGRAAGRAGGDARGRARRSAGAESAERARLRRLRGGGADASPSSASPACWRSR